MNVHDEAPAGNMEEQGAMLAGGKTAGLAMGTKVATSLGWRPVEAVVPGDRVLTFDSGMQEITHVTRGVLWQGPDACPRRLWPLMVPAGALGNAQSMTILPDQPVVIESEVGKEIYGDPFTLVPAGALEGFRGIERMPPEAEAGVVTLHFHRDQVVFGSAGALFYCPTIRSLSVVETLDELQSDYVVLGYEDAEFLIGCIEIDALQKSAGPEEEAEPAEPGKKSSQAAVAA